MTTQPNTDEGSFLEQFMASNYGRAVRLSIGLVLIALGLAVIPLPAGLAVAALGLIPVSAGVFNLCPVAPLWGGHFFGSQYCRARTRAGSK